MSGRYDTQFEVVGAVARLTLDRPEIRNALTGERMLAEIIEAFDEAEANAAVTVLVLGASGPAFSAGGNIKEMAQGTGLFAGSPATITEAYRQTIQRLTTVLLNSDLVTIAAVNGPAIGAGFDLVLGCDLRLGSTAARFAHTFVELGIIPGDGGAWLLHRVVGPQRAAELAFTSRPVGAAEAKELGILLDVTEPEKLEERVDELASLIAAKPAHALRLTKRLLRHARTMRFDEFLDLTAALQAIAHHEDEHRAAVDRYMQRMRERQNEKA